jgi:hypothetical protein
MKEDLPSRTSESLVLCHRRRTSKSPLTLSCTQCIIPLCLSSLLTSLYLSSLLNTSLTKNNDFRASFRDGPQQLLRFSQIVAIPDKSSSTLPFFFLLQHVYYQVMLLGFENIFFEFNILYGIYQPSFYASSACPCFRFY